MPVGIKRLVWRILVKWQSFLLWVGWFRGICDSYFGDCLLSVILCIESCYGRYL